MKFSKIIFLLVTVVTILGLPLDVMIPDAALYARLSKTIFLNQDFINLYLHGVDWLDKPHLPFWLTAISYSIFGISNFAYKIPGVLVFFFGCWITYKFTKENYNKETAIYTVIILLTSTHSVISNFDVRAEPYLTGFMIATFYWLHKYIKLNNLKDLIIGCLFAALSIMTKGIFAIIPIGCAIVGNLLLKKDWKKVFNPMWVVAIILILIFIIPELYTLYFQFDIHPEKVVFGKTNVSGIKFFFWDSQFGRFFNNGPITGSGDKLFFFHTILWAFLPWGILFYLASFLKLKHLKTNLKNEEFYSFFGAWSAIILFSLSKFQLPHYTNVVFPFMAIITGNFIYKIRQKNQFYFKSYLVIQIITIGIGLLLVPLLLWMMKPKFNYWFILFVLTSIFITYMVLKSKNTKTDKVFYTTAIAFCAIYAFLMSIVYPTLLQYQGTIEIARFTNQKKQTIYVLNDLPNYGFLYYNNNNIKKTTIKNLNSLKEEMLFVSDKELNRIKKNKVHFTIEKIGLYYPITRLTKQFIDKNTREKTLSKYYAIRLN